MALALKSLLKVKGLRKRQKSTDKNKAPTGAL
jgi:hypothetical protein